jgi:hypothetical protein
MMGGLACVLRVALRVRLQLISLLQYAMPFYRTNIIICVTSMFSTFRLGSRDVLCVHVSDSKI